jgi:hypothetical protein
MPNVPNMIRRLLMEQQAPQYAAIEESMPEHAGLEPQYPPIFGESLPALPEPGEMAGMAEIPRNVLRAIQEAEIPPQQMPLTTVEDTRSWRSEPGSDLPMNSMRVESGPNAGRTRSMNFVSNAPGWWNDLQQDFSEGRALTGKNAPASGMHEPEPEFQSDFSRPIEIAGVGKGYWEKGGTGNAIVNGKRVPLGVDRNATNKRMAQELALAQGRQNLRKGEVDIAKDLAALFTPRVKDDPNSQANLEKRFGKLPEGVRWRSDGTPEPIPGGQRNQDATDVIGILDMAEPLIGQATGSYAGTGVDELGRFLGWSSPEADAAAQLKALQGLLVSKMPKMSGPQSDRDVQLYKEMAGRIGDSTVPPGQKRAAMNVIRQLNERYATPGAAGSSPAGGQGNAAALLQEARDAIARGAPREAVMKRLRERGITGGL